MSSHRNRKRTQLRCLSMWIMICILATISLQFLRVPDEVTLQHQEGHAAEGLSDLSQDSNLPTLLPDDKLTTLLDYEKVNQFPPQWCDAGAGNCICIDRYNVTALPKCDLNQDKFKKPNLVTVWVGGWFLNPYYFLGYNQCPESTCLVSNENQAQADGTVVIDLHPRPWYRRLDDFRHMILVETNEHFGEQYREHRWLGDTFSSYRDAPMLISYPDQHPDEYRRLPLPFQQKKKAAAWFASNCSPEFRNKLITRVRELFPVDALGPCLNSNSVPNVAPHCTQYVSPHKTQKLCVIRDYMFTMALENSRDKRYITEKLWDALLVGSVPVYYGAPDVLEYVPRNSIIHVADFETFDDLAAYLNKVANNETLYNEYLRWKLEPYPQGFLDTVRVSFGNYFCRICDMTLWQRTKTQCAMRFYESLDLQRSESSDAVSSWFQGQVFLVPSAVEEAKANAMSSLLQSIQISSSLIARVNSESLTEDVLECFSPKEYSYIDGRSRSPEPLTTVELSQVIQHYAVYHHVVTKGTEYALVLEEDAKLDIPAEQVPKVVAKLMEQLPKDFDLLFLSDTDNLHCEEASSASVEKPALCKVWPHRSRIPSAYIVSTSGAMKLFKNLPVRWPLRKLMDESLHGLNMYWSEPVLFK